MEIEFTSSKLIPILRQMACTGATIRMLAEKIREVEMNLGHLSIGQTVPSLVVCRYFRAAFQLGLMDIRDIEGSSCLGGTAYDDAEIDLLLLPKIAATRQMWDRKTNPNNFTGDQ